MLECKTNVFCAFAVCSLIPLFRFFPCFPCKIYVHAKLHYRLYYIQRCYQGYICRRIKTLLNMSLQKSAFLIATLHSTAFQKHVVQ